MPSLLPNSGSNPQINASGNVNINSANSPGNTYTRGNFTDPTGAIVNKGNIAYTGSPNSADALAGKGIETVATVDKSSPTLMNGGKRRKMHHRKSKKHHTHKHKKYNCKHHSHRRKSSHRKSYKKSRKMNRTKRGGYYQQYLGNVPFSMGMKMPGMNLPSKLSALANPTIFKPYNNCMKDY